MKISSKELLAIEVFSNMIRLMINNWLDHIRKWEFTPLCVLVFLVLVLHLTTITQPKAAYTNGVYHLPLPGETTVSLTVFDERYYYSAATDLLQGAEGRTEHPPLGQAIIAFGLWIFGNNPIGGRIFSVLFGSVLLIMFYLMCRELKLTKSASLFATTLLAVDDLSFVLSGVAMLDVFCLTFMLISTLLYLRNKFVLSGLFLGLATLSKLTGVCALLFIGLHWLITNRKNIIKPIMTTVVAVITFLVLLPTFSLIFQHQIPNPFVQIQHMVKVSTSLTFANFGPNAINISSDSIYTPTRPWEWLYKLGGLNNLVLDISKIKYVPVYPMIINPAIWVLIIPVIIHSVYLLLKRKKAGIFIFCWLAATYLIWIPISIITDRLTYTYYFYPAVGAICMGIALLFSQINIKFKLIAPLYLGISLIMFISLYVGNVWLRVSWAILFCVFILYYMSKYPLNSQDSPLSSSKS